jgi:hypothetical protein
MPNGAINLACPVNRSHPLARGLVSFWLPLPGRMGRIYLDDIAGRNHGTLTNGPTWVGGPNGFGAVNGSSGGYVNFAAGPTLLNEFVVTARFRTPSSFSGDQQIFRLNGGAAANAIWFYLRNSDGSVRVDDFNSSGGMGFQTLDMTGALAASTWYTISYRLVSGTQEIWRDGVLAGSRSYSGSRNTTNQPAALGLIAQPNGTQPLNGVLGCCIVQAAAVSPMLVHQEIMRAFPTLLNYLPRRVSAEAGGAAPTSNRRRRLICGAAR